MTISPYNGSSITLIKALSFLGARPLASQSTDRAPSAGSDRMLWASRGSLIPRYGLK